MHEKSVDKLDSSLRVFFGRAVALEPKTPRFKEICLTFEKRDDEGLRVYSDDVPGFVLAHSDPDTVFADIKPALETILSEMFSKHVTVGPLEQLRDDLEDNGYMSTSK
jgi:hypothetical protein